MSDEEKKRAVQIEVHLDESKVNGDYVNMARIFHNQSEFVLDALFLPPGSKKASVRARLILSPTHAKFLHAALGQNIDVYQKKFGKIEAKPGGSGGQGPILH
jgi:hypothetical protein